MVAGAGAFKNAKSVMAQQNSKFEYQRQQNQIVQEIGKGIFLVREFARRPDDSEQLIFKITNDALKDIELMLNFNGSKHILEISENPPR